MMMSFSSLKKWLWHGVGKGQCSCSHSTIIYEWRWFHSPLFNTMKCLKKIVLFNTSQWHHPPTQHANLFVLMNKRNLSPQTKTWNL
jgi:hypothetical protein